ncbi:hypothetical protein SLEP1_g44239 [Rubroshorea leprosula]|uniref:Uncharacterized protein n=1 Tax=Rubroshorea leprosula TaxID=152421 RepID=A0AAV5LGA2_9ROSI|nr:hypothetical protein SLEP1_g44239 [Rubroshorea leprosula]
MEPACSLLRRPLAVCRSGGRELLAGNPRSGGPLPDQVPTCTASPPQRPGDLVRTSSMSRLKGVPLLDRAHAFFHSLVLAAAVAASSSKQTQIWVFQTQIWVCLKPRSGFETNPDLVDSWS